VHQIQLFGIADSLEIEGVSWGRRASTTTILGFDDGSEVLDRQAPLTDLEERPDDGAHHIAQEAVGRDREDPLTRLRAWAPVSLGHTAVIRLDVGMELAEAREVREV